jgi:hypothetical protein
MRVFGRPRRFETMFSRFFVFDIFVEVADKCPVNPQMNSEKSHMYPNVGKCSIRFRKVPTGKYNMPT